MRLAGWNLLAGLLVAATIVGVPVVVAAKKPPRADLAVTAASAEGVTVRLGGTVRVRLTVRNRGRVTSGASVVRAFLSGDRRRGADLPLGGSAAIGRLKAGASSSPTKGFKVPATLAVGRYHVLVCADAARKVKESSETNNCRATKQVDLLAADGAGGGGGTGETGTGGTGGGGGTGETGGGGGETGGTGGTGETGGGTGETGGGGGETGETGGTGGDPPPPSPDRDNDGSLNAADCAPDDATIHPAADDRPDGAFVDRNCDGYDGDATRAVHVAPGGSAADDCGPRANPCGTVAKGIARATALALSQVYVRGGDYSEFKLLVPVSVYGGFGDNWKRGPAASGVTEAKITEVATQEGLGQGNHAIGVLVSGITGVTELADLTIIGMDATGNIGGAGNTSYGVAVLNVPPGRLTLRRLKITAGRGADGIAGANAIDSPQVGLASRNGTAGGNSGNSGATVCNTTSAPGGDAGTGVTNGGAGGRGGREDTACPNGTGTGGTAPESGQNGGSGQPEGGLGGGGGTGGPGGGNGAGQQPCGPGGNGDPGQTVHGAPGAAGTARGRLLSGDADWHGDPGASGTLGQNGGAGGGGGGSGACEVPPDGAFYGSGGGGGGAGGARNGQTATGGRGGGGSIALHVINSSVAIDALTLTRGNGGAGGKGGNGGLGGIGGVGGAGGTGLNNNPLLKGGNGGHGAPGGNSGGAAGGSGGASIGIFVGPGSGVSAVPVTVTGGAAGQGGLGGDSDGPVADASAGTAGMHTHTLACVTAAGC